MSSSAKQLSMMQFATALCCVAHHALAQEADATSEQASEEQPRQEAPVELNYVDQVMQALQNPSGEHLQIYIQLGLAAAIAIGLIYTGLQSLNKPEVQGFSLDDDGPATAGGKAVSKKARAKVRKPQGEQFQETMNKRRGELVDGILSKADSKDSGTSEALYEALDKEGPWTIDDYGLMDAEIFVKFRRIIATNQFKRFIARKEELLQERLTHYKSQNFAEYKRCIQQTSQEYQALGITTTQEACEYVSLGEQNYESSFKQAKSLDHILKKIQEDEANTRLYAEPPRDVKFSRDEIKKMHMEKTAKEFEAEKKLAKMQVSSQQELMGIMMVERTKVMDELYLKYNVRMVDLMKGYKEHNLAQDPEVMTQSKAHQAEKQQMVDEINKAEALSEAQMAVLTEAIAGSGGPITDPLENGAVLSYVNLMKVMSTLVRLTTRFTKEKTVTYLDDRRKLFEAGDEQGYAKCVVEYLKKQGIVKQHVMMQLFSDFGVSAELFQKSQMYYKQSEEHKKQFQKDLESFEFAEQRAESKQDISKDDALKYVNSIEESKAEASAGMAIAMKMGKLGPQQAQMMQMVAKARAFDKLWKDTGVEEADVHTAFYTYGLSDSDEFKEIMTKNQRYMQECIQAEARKLQEMMAQMGQGRRGPPGMSPQQMMAQMGQMPGQGGMDPRMGMPGMPGQGGPPGAGARPGPPRTQPQPPVQTRPPQNDDDVAHMDF